MLSWHLLVCFLKWIWKIQFPAAFWRIKLHRQFLHVETVKSCSFLFLNSWNCGCRTLGITSVSMALCPHVMRGEALGLHAPNTGAPWDWEEDMLSQPIQDGEPQLAASSFLPWWHELKLYESRTATEVSESRVTFWCEEGQDAAVSWPRAGQQGGGDVSIVWISMKPPGTMYAQTHWARRRRRHGCCTRASQKALNVFLFEKQRVLVKNNIWLSIPHTASLNFQYNTHPPNPEWKLTVWPEELV